MSSLFRQISEQAQQQRQAVEQSTTSSDSPTLLHTNPTGITAQKPEKTEQTPKRLAPSKSATKHAKQTVAPQSGTMAPEGDTTAPPIKPQLALEKLETVVRELSQLTTNSNGLNVRLSEQEAQDMEDFIHGSLRRRGLKGYEVSAAKLMRYAFRYLSRVHEDEFIVALEHVLKVEEKLSI